MSWLLALCLFSLYTSSQCSGSTAGDRDPWVRNCIGNCVLERNCQDPYNNNFVNKAPWILRFTFWDCEADCKYLCMRVNEENRDIKGLPVFQYNGKWPFYRVLGLQEIASSLFSIGNLIPYLLGVLEYRKKVPDTYYLRPLFIAYGICGCLTWFFSFIFHCRDTNETEFLDYLFASFTYFFGSVWTTIRVLNVQRWSYIYLIIAIFGLWCFQHWYYMLNTKFDYDYNILVGVINGIYQTLAWSIWYCTKGRGGERTYAKNIVFGYACLWIAGTMELWDFPPIFGLIDPHSLWHLGTIPLAFLLWSFLVADSIYEDNLVKLMRYHLG